MGSEMCIRDRLKVPLDEKIDERIESVRRTRTAFSSRIKNEILVVFDSSSTRDFVFSHGKNLAADPATGTKSTHGMRLDYPAHLGSDYRALDSYGGKLRKDVGQGFRRNIRFDDDEMGLFMDINFPEQEKWICVTPKMAREKKGENTVRGEAEAAALIDAALEGIVVVSGANSQPLPQSNSFQSEVWRQPKTNNLGEPMA